MAKRKPKDKRQEIVSEAQSDQKSSKKTAPKKKTKSKKNIPAAKPKKEISENEVFTGDKDFYKLLSESQKSDAKKQDGEQRISG